jgi:antitoxin VapB
LVAIRIAGPAEHVQRASWPGSLAELFRSGRSQAVRLPHEFRFDGDRVRIRRVARGVLLEPLVTDTAEWFAELDRDDPEPFMVEGRNQPTTPVGAALP